MSAPVVSTMRTQPQERVQSGDIDIMNQRSSRLLASLSTDARRPRVRNTPGTLVHRWTQPFCRRRTRTSTFRSPAHCVLHCTRQFQALQDPSVSRNSRRCP